MKLSARKRPTRGQLLTKALKQCKKTKSKHKRTQCEKLAKKKYGRQGKHKARKKYDAPADPEAA